MRLGGIRLKFKGLNKLKIADITLELNNLMCPKCGRKNDLTLKIPYHVLNEYYTIKALSRNFKPIYYFPSADFEKSLEGCIHSLMCPRCGAQVKIFVKVSPAKIELFESPQIHQHLKKEESVSSFEKLNTNDRVIFGIGRYFDVYKRPPSLKVLSRFLGLSPQTISRYIRKCEELIVCGEQGRGRNGKFAEKYYVLTDKGKNRYSEIVYKLVFGETSERKF